MHTIWLIRIMPIICPNFGFVIVWPYYYSQFITRSLHILWVVHNMAIILSNFMETGFELLSTFASPIMCPNFDTSSNLKSFRIIMVLWPYYGHEPPWIRSLPTMCSRFASPIMCPKFATSSNWTKTRSLHILWVVHNMAIILSNFWNA